LEVGVSADNAFEIRGVMGVDFSGAKLAGETIWVARCSVLEDGAGLKLDRLDQLAELAGSAEREVALRFLVGMIESLEGELVGMDFPFGLPIELGLGDWPEQMRFVSEWPGSATELGRECVRRCLERTGSMHVRRETDRETRTPFDCYHYRIIHQTFHGMRDVLGRLGEGTCVVPMQLGALERARRVVVEACPSSTLKRLGLPHQNYKSPAGPMEAKHRETRKTILRTLRRFVEMSPGQVRAVNQNRGGDALDAVIAAVGVFSDWRRCDWETMRSHERYAREGRVFG
jgi:hypothetical protein